LVPLVPCHRECCWSCDREIDADQDCVDVPCSDCDLGFDFDFGFDDGDHVNAIESANDECRVYRHCESETMKNEKLIKL
jgi:hypothetical protein